MSFDWADIETEPYCNYFQARPWMELLAACTNRSQALTHRTDRLMEYATGWFLLDQQIALFDPNYFVDLGLFPTEESVDDHAFTHEQISGLIAGIWGVLQWLIKDDFADDETQGRKLFRDYTATTHVEWKRFRNVLPLALPPGYVEQSRDMRWGGNQALIERDGPIPTPHFYKYFVEHFRDVLESMEEIELVYRAGGVKYSGVDREPYVSVWSNVPYTSPRGAYIVVDGATGDKRGCCKIVYYWDRPFPSDEHVSDIHATFAALNAKENGYRFGNASCEHVPRTATITFSGTEINPDAIIAPAPSGPTVGHRLFETTKPMSDVLPGEISDSPDLFPIPSDGFYANGIAYECCWEVAGDTTGWWHWHNSPFWPYWELQGGHYWGGQRNSDLFGVHRYVGPSICTVRYTLPLALTAPPSPVSS